MFMLDRKSAKRYGLACAYVTYFAFVCVMFQSKEPLKEIQRGKLLRIPVHSQQQVSFTIPFKHGYIMKPFDRFRV